MRTGILTLLSTFFIISTYSNLSGQTVEAKKNCFENHPVDFALGNFSVGIPFSKVFIGKYYPLATLGTEFYYLDSEHSQIYQTAKIGGYYNRYNTSAFFLNTEIAYRYTLDFGLFGDAGLGVGYAHLFHPNAIYEPDDNGVYEQISDWGKPSMMADFSLSIGYDFSRQLNKPLSFFLRYGNYIQLFYNTDIPVLPQNSFQIGTRFFIRKK